MQLTVGVDFCHKKSIVNRDLKPENTLGGFACPSPPLLPDIPVPQPLLAAHASRKVCFRWVLHQGSCSLCMEGSSQHRSHGQTLQLRVMASWPVHQAFQCPVQEKSSLQSYTRKGACTPVCAQISCRIHQGLVADARLAQHLLFFLTSVPAMQWSAAGIRSRW